MDELPNSRALRGDRVASERLLVTNLRGEERVVIVSAAPFYDDTELLGAAVIWQEITEREREIGGEPPPGGDGTR
jgi:hypothetical protein